MVPVSYQQTFTVTWALVFDLINWKLVFSNPPEHLTQSIRIFYQQTFTVTWTLVFGSCHPPERLTAVPAPPLHLPLGYRVPAEVELPVESAPSHVGAGDVLKRVVRDHVDDGAHHRRPERKGG